MKAYVFPGQGSQFPGMGKDLYENNSEAKAMFDKANEILGFDIADIMFNGTEEDLKQTKVTQPAVFLYSPVSHLRIIMFIEEGAYHIVYQFVFKIEDIDRKCSHKCHKYKQGQFKQKL